MLVGWFSCLSRRTSSRVHFLNVQMHFFHCPHLYVSFVRTFVAIHTLHSGLFALPQVDAEEWPSSHGILHTGVMRWQIHPADDKQSIHLCGKMFK